MIQMPRINLENTDLYPHCSLEHRLCSYQAAQIPYLPYLVL